MSKIRGVLEKNSFFLELYQLGIIKFGDFTLKSSLKSPFYIDFRPIASSPELLKKLAKILQKEARKKPTDLICGVPYAALPMATALSLESDIPMIIKRKENKDYGTQRLIEGLYDKGQSCLLIEDVITSGESLLETIESLEKEEIQVSTILVVLDREQGGMERLCDKGYHIQALFHIHEVLDLLDEKKLLESQTLEDVRAFLKETLQMQNLQRISYEKKREKITHPTGRKLLDIALKKKSNLILSADLTKSQSILQLASSTGSHLCALKLHADIIEDFSAEFIGELKTIAQKNHFLLIEDRKFGDIRNSTALQFYKGIFRIAHWADMVTVHLIAGSKSLSAFEKSSSGLISIAKMSSEGQLMDANYTKKVLNISRKHPQIIGSVCQQRIPEDLLLFTPGVHLEDISDGKGQKYLTPQRAFNEQHTDFIIVGRGVYQGNDPVASAKAYRKHSWIAYEESLN
ncbi:orotidine-5'-phosphate decarboxylase [Bacteroidetes bacterium endosymbiont of Geopemphigus sp.]|uniref:orotidine-5'-phosphate decarboxylase n=1 Tax=Bacteroidetes bacterium endosymbiont of Geopemphigus sp. TaxID=2047937 RepID=UPI001F4D4F99|nr:orotidine-5'-phosphate decarboxylase [Bacteroidetes bacterium endosymbiont of Geopemphigus sp.]